MLAQLRDMVRGVFFELIRPVALLAATLSLSLSAAGALDAIAAEAEQQGGRGRGRAAGNAAVELYDRGVELVGKEKYEEAIESFDQAIEANERYGMAHYQRGRALALMGRMEEAKEALLLSTTLQPGFAHGHQLASLAAQQLADYPTAWDQAVRAVLAGVEPGQFGGLQQASPAPPDVMDRLAAWKVFVVGVDTRELMASEQRPDNARGGVTDIRSTLGQVQGDLFEVQRLVSVAISDTPGFGLVPSAEMAQYLLVIVPESISADPRNTMEGELRLLSVEGNEVVFTRPVSFRNLSAGSAVAVEIEQFIDVIESWKSERQ